MYKYKKGRLKAHAGVLSPVIRMSFPYFFFFFKIAETMAIPASTKKAIVTIVSMLGFPLSAFCDSVPVVKISGFPCRCPGILLF